MNVKTKIILGYPLIGNANRKARKITRKMNKELEGETSKYPSQWRNDYMLKKAKGVAKKLNIELEVIGWENLPKAPAILAPNHSSSFDPALIVMALENPGKSSDDINHQSVFVAKDTLLENKRSAGWATLNDTFFLRRSNPRDALQTLDDFTMFAKDEKRFAVIFPGGTREKTGEVGEFKGGAFRMAKKHFLPIVPVTINNALSISDLTRTEKLKVQVIFGKTIKPLSLITQSTKEIAANVQREVSRAWKAPEGKRAAKEDKLA